MRRIVVTGANKGIGRAIAEGALAEGDDTFVWLGARDVGRGEAARAEMIEAHPGWGGRLEVLELDVTSDASVEAAARTVGERLGDGEALYGVVNNAGIGRAHGMARVLDVNVRGIRRVCEALLPHLAPDGGRIVNVTSASGPVFVSKCSESWQRFFLDETTSWSDLEALMERCVAMEGDEEAFAAEGLGDGDAYGLSKACANTYTLQLAAAHPELRVNACTPGFIETDMTRGYAEAQGKAPRELGMKPPEEGAKTPLFLLFGDPEGNGRYYGSDAERSPMHRYRSPGDPPYTGD